MKKTKDLHIEIQEKKMFDNPLDHQINPITGWRVEYENFWCSRSTAEAIKRPNKVSKYLNR